MTFLKNIWNRLFCTKKNKEQEFDRQAHKLDIARMQKLARDYQQLQETYKKIATQYTQLLMRTQKREKQLIKYLHAYHVSLMPEQQSVEVEILLVDYLKHNPKG
jgi:uncharacterized membrane-anchored protein YhcB (DUF1043 family)